MTTNTITVSLIGERLRANWMLYLDDVLSSTEAYIDIDLPLKPEQYADLLESDELFESLDRHELSALTGYLEAIINLLAEDTGVDSESECLLFYWEAVKLQCKIQWIVIDRGAKKTKKKLKKFSEEMGLSMSE